MKMSNKTMNLYEDKKDDKSMTMFIIQLLKETDISK